MPFTRSSLLPLVKLQCNRVLFTQLPGGINPIAPFGHKTGIEFALSLWSADLRKNDQQRSIVGRAPFLGGRLKVPIKVHGKWQIAKLPYTSGSVGHLHRIPSPNRSHILGVLVYRFHGCIPPLATEQSEPT